MPFLLAAVPAGHVAVPIGLRVMSHTRELRSIPKLCDTWIAATQGPRCVKFAQTCFGVVPVGSSFWRFADSFELGSSKFQPGKPAGAFPIPLP